MIIVLIQQAQKQKYDKYDQKEMYVLISRFTSFETDAQSVPNRRSVRLEQTLCCDRIDVQFGPNTCSVPTKQMCYSDQTDALFWYLKYAGKE